MISERLASVLAKAYVAAPGPPIDVGRQEASRAAREELSDRIYQTEQPGVVSRIIDWVFDKIVNLLGDVLGLDIGGTWWLLVLLALLILVIVLIRWRVGALQRASPSPASSEVFGAEMRTAAEHRRAAEDAARLQEWRVAVQERFRALVRELEERTILDERPGRTADEVAREIGAEAPDSAETLRRAAATFDDVCYGYRPARPESYEIIRAADDIARRLRAGDLVAAGTQ